MAQLARWGMGSSAQPHLKIISSRVSQVTGWEYISTVSCHAGCPGPHFPCGPPISGLSDHRCSPCSRFLLTGSHLIFLFHLLSLSS